MARRSSRRISGRLTQIDCQIELKLQTETSLREIKAARLFRQVGLRILRVDDDRRGPLVSLIDELQQVTFRPSAQITPAPRMLYRWRGMELPRSADTAFREAATTARAQTSWIEP